MVKLSRKASKGSSPTEGTKGSTPSRLEVALEHLCDVHKAALTRPQGFSEVGCQFCTLLSTHMCYILPITPHTTHYTPHTSSHHTTPHTTHHLTPHTSHLTPPHTITHHTPHTSHHTPPHTTSHHTPHTLHHLTPPHTTSHHIGLYLY